MALANSVTNRGGKQPSKVNLIVPIEVTLDANYPAGGYDFDVAELVRSLGGYDKAPVVLDAVVGRHPTGYAFAVDLVNDKLIAFVPAGTEVVGATDLAAAIGGPITVMAFAL